MHFPHKQIISTQLFFIHHVLAFFAAILVTFLALRKTFV